MAVVGAETALLLLPNVLLRRKQPENGKKEISPVLEPNFDLPLGEAELVGHLDSPSPREVVVRVELLFQLECLVPTKQACHVLATQQCGVPRQFLMCACFRPLCKVSVSELTWCKSGALSSAARWPQ